eukprot:5131293-Amphidinium_carterae.1
MPWALHAHVAAGYTSVAQPLGRAFMRMANLGDFSIAVVLAANRPKLDAMERVMLRDSIHDKGADDTWDGLVKTAENATECTRVWHSVPSRQGKVRC